jgi:hypothetical protein
MEILNNFFSFNSVFKVGAIVFSFLFVVLTIQMHANVSQVIKSVVTGQNLFYLTISKVLVAISVLLFLLAFVIL